MTTTPPTPVAHRFSFEVELPAPPEVVWPAIATGAGLSSWFLPTELDERVGGRMVTHMGDTSVPGEITGFDPPRRLAFEEEWAEMSGHPDSPVTPLATEMVLEARSGGTCVLRVVTSAFGEGADWEAEFLADMQSSWRPFFDVLALYVDRFPGRTAEVLEVEATTDRSTDALRRSLRDRLGGAAQGDRLVLNGLGGVVELTSDDGVVVALDDGGEGFLSLYLFDVGDHRVAAARAQLFDADAAATAAAARPGWQAWVEDLATSDG